MSNVVPNVASNIVYFTPPPLEPFLGTWIRDPLSVSRDKVAKRMLGEEGLRRLWSCGSMAELRRALRDDRALAEKYDALRRTGSEGRLVVDRRLMTWVEIATAYTPARTRSAPITGIRAEGRIVVVQSGRSTVSGHALRQKDEWLLVSERHSGRNAECFPRSPVFRYFRPERDGCPAGAA
jgi:hypothetical protein